MSGPQFIHIQTWSRKSNKAGQSIAQVIAEATRDPEYSTHVAEPHPPRILLGNLEKFKADHDAHVAARSTIVQMADGSERERAIRTDRHTMASIIMSYPVPYAAINTDEQRQKLEAWEKRNLDWLKEKYGDQLYVVLAHDDEPYPHIHAWLLPDDPGCDATTLHPGKLAKKQAEAFAKADGLEPREAVKLGNRALKEAMTGWQDEYYVAVGAPCGLTRSGPNRRRLSREQWRAEKATANAQAVVLNSVETIEEKETSVREASSELLSDRDALEKERKELLKSKTDVDDERALLLQARKELDEREMRVQELHDALLEMKLEMKQMKEQVKEILEALKEKLPGLNYSMKSGIKSAMRELLTIIKPPAQIKIASSNKSLPERSNDSFDQSGPGL